MAIAKLSCSRIISVAWPFRELIAAQFCGLLVLGVVQSVQAAPIAQINPWRTVAQQAQADSAGRAWLQPEKFTAFDLDHSALKQILKESSIFAATNSIAIPLPDGSISTFQFVEAPVMEPQLAAKFPEIRTFLGQGVDDPRATVRFDITPAGFHAQIILPDAAAYV